LTLFLYLNDVEEGGETHFPHIDTVVKPKRGRAVLWPSVLNEAPNIKDFRTEHEAWAVKKGIKYGANAWMHQRDYRVPHYSGCV
jgi:prolyl 4-hydroxylase